jgi:hypothetical protein
MGQTAVPPSGIRKNILTNPGVALLAQSGYSEGFILDMIYHKQTQFDVSAEGLAWLAKQGLSERIIRTMVANENKEEQTAIFPAMMSTSLPPVNVPEPSMITRRRVNVAMSPTLPTATAPTSSIEVRGWERDRWYSNPNVPLLVVGQR